MLPVQSWQYILDLTPSDPELQGIVGSRTDTSVSRGKRVKQLVQRICIVSRQYKGGLGLKTSAGNHIKRLGHSTGPPLAKSPKSPLFHIKSPFHHFNPAGSPGIAQMQAWPVRPLAVCTSVLSGSHK